MRVQKTFIYYLILFVMMPIKINIILEKIVLTTHAHTLLTYKILALKSMS